jgi:hypothetical protein
MQAETPEVAILGVNAVGYESGNASITDGRVLPWLQDVPEEDVWGTWAVTYRDVVVLDEENQVRAVYNLTEHDLADPAAYAELRDLLVAP